MSECAVCSSPAPYKCAGCKSVSYCSPAHQKEDWKAHKKVCARLALETREYEERLALEAKDAEEHLLRITTCLAQNGYHTEVGVMVQLNKAFWNDEQIWDAFKDVPGPEGRTRLLYASMRGLLGRVKWLFARGAVLNKTNSAIKVTGDLTVLTSASSSGHLEIVRELCARGVDVNASTAADGFTALMSASWKGRLEIVGELCARGANVNAAMTNTGCTALMWASQHGHLEVVRELCVRGANVNAACADGMTPLMLASKNGFLKIARSLLKMGANKSDTTPEGHTAFSIATGPLKAALQALLKP